MWVHDSFGYSIQKDLKTFLGYLRNDQQKVRKESYEIRTIDNVPPLLNSPGGVPGLI
jgi:hypothetical protein